MVHLSPNVTMVLGVLVLAFQATCVLWQTGFAYLKRDRKISKDFLISKDDHISRLPDDILYSIISLTVRDAAKLSFLSRRWRYICVSMPDLNFDLHTVFGAPSVFQVWNDETTRHRCPKYKRRFVKIVNQFLKLYLGPKIRYFRISFCLERESSRLIDQCVSLAVRMGVEKFELNFVCSECPFGKDRYHNLYRVSLQLLSEASNLKHLRLYGCILKPDLIGRFERLTHLYLYVVIFTQVELQMVLGNCSNLENLTVRECTLPVQVCISSDLHLLRLKFFALVDCVGLRNLDLSATNLTSLEIKNGEEIKITFSNVPKLENVFFGFGLMCRNSMPYIFGEVAKVLPQLKTLSILTCTELVENIPTNPTVFSNVKQLELFICQYWRSDLLKIIAPILNALPLLQKLYVVLPPSTPKNLEIRVEELPSHLHSQLKEVEIGGFCGNWNEIEFAIYLLKNAVALERMVIDAWFRAYLGGGNWRNGYSILWSEKKYKFICDQLLGKVFSRKTQVIIRQCDSRQ